MDNPFNNCTLPSVLRETETTIYTNDSSVPNVLALRLIDIYEEAYSGKPELATISATEFVGSNKQILLKQRRIKDFYKLTKEVSSIQQSVLGTIMHSGIYPNEPSRRTKKIGKWTISGQADNITEGTLYDLKYMAVFTANMLQKEMRRYNSRLALEDLKVKFPTIFKFTIQLSIYNWLYDLKSEVGYILQVVSNWSIRDRSTIPNKSSLQDIEIYSHKEVVEYLTKRLDIIEQYQNNGTLPDCSLSEIGSSKSSIFKLVRPGKDRRVSKSKECDTYEEATKEQLNFNNTVIHEVSKSTTPLLCIQYCDFNKTGFCTQGAELSEEYSR
jgi:hypothetical protein